MKILHTADWHIGQFKGPVVDGVNLRSQDTVKCLEYTLHRTDSFIRSHGILMKPVTISERETCTSIEQDFRKK